jgi:hypothetical protein
MYHQAYYRLEEAPGLTVFRRSAQELIYLSEHAETKYFEILSVEYLTTTSDNIEANQFMLVAYESNR